MSIARISGSNLTPSGKLYAYICDKGNLRIWDTDTNEIKQEYEPNEFEEGLCSAFTWLPFHEEEPDKKIEFILKTDGSSEEHLHMTIGTTKGKLLYLSLPEGKVLQPFRGCGHITHITAMVCNDLGQLFTCSLDCRVALWSLREKKQISVLYVGPETPNCMAFISHSNILIVGGRQIKLYSVKSHQLIASFTGHESGTSLLDYILVDGHEYIISSAKNESIICLWKCNTNKEEKLPVMTYLIDDIIQCLSCRCDKNRFVQIGVVTRKGVINIYQLPLKSSKYIDFLQSSATIRIVSNSPAVDDAIPAVVINLNSRNKTNELFFGYGDQRFLTFESLDLKVKNLQILQRTNPKKIVSYKLDKVPIETLRLSKRLKSVLQMNILENKSCMNISSNRNQLFDLKFNLSNPHQPKSESNVEYLIHILESKNTKLLSSVLLTNDEKITYATLKEIPLKYIGTFIKELTLLMNFDQNCAIKWLKSIIKIHYNELSKMKKKELFNIFEESLAQMEYCFSNITAIAKIIYCLDLIIYQNKYKLEQKTTTVPYIFVKDDFVIYHDRA
ncbi:WD repeat-containing protein 43-like [Teleopsis dalmanni]|uniref:WD repeat-containing protein 43-like n=1 Tax=Teleopsis dalmanni TaxID=139649 RepID=UPI0018CCE5DF|nr:WD repeat-containing protein 43-like [Teleopsis dalmanni]